MKKKILNQKGFSTVEAILVFVVILLIGGIGLYVKHHSKKISESNNNSSQDAATEETRYENKDLGFQFSYPKTWGEVKIEEDVSTKTMTGKVYDLTFSGLSYKYSSGIKTRTWAGENGNTRTGFVEYNECGLKGEDNFVVLHKTEDTCLVVIAEEAAVDANGYGGKTATIRLQKEFSTSSEFAGLEFQGPPISIENFSQETIKSAIDEDIRDGLLLVAKTLREI